MDQQATEYLRKAAETVETDGFPLCVTMYVRSEGVQLHGQFRRGQILHGAEVKRIVPWIELTDCKTNPLLSALDLMVKACERSVMEMPHGH